MSLLDLKRYPHFSARKTDPLQAWDAADVLMIHHIKNSTQSVGRLLILGDQWGALGTELLDFKPILYTDSFISAKALESNSQAQLKALSKLKDLKNHGPFDSILIKAPKNQSFLEEMLWNIKPLLNKNAQVICGVMVKHQSPSTFDLLARYIGPTTTSLAQKKARLIFCSPGNSVEQPLAPKSPPYPLLVSMPGFEKPFVHDSNLFSREKLDIGTRFFLEHIPKLSHEHPVCLDLGCANGIIGIQTKRLNPSAHLIFSDDSYMAIQCAQINYATQIKSESKPPEFWWTHCFENQPADFLDWVFCNPPFHQHAVIGDFIARQMFKDAHFSLKKGGHLRIVGNSHLKYGQLLKHLFGNSKLIASNAKFMIHEATKV